MFVKKNQFPHKNMGKFLFASSKIPVVITAEATEWH